MPVQAGLEDGAGVVVEAAGDREVGHDLDAVGDQGRATLQHRCELTEPLVEQLVLHAEGTDAVDEGGVGGADRRQVQAAPGLLRGEPGVGDQQAVHLLARELVELVDDPHHPLHVGGAEAGVEALDQLAVVDLEPEPGQAEHLRVGQGDEGGQHHPGHLDVVVEGEGVAPDHVDVGLGELAEAPLLGTLAAPDLLHLVAAEGEVELAGVLQHVAGERHGQVEVQADPCVALGVVQALEDVDLLRGLPLAQQLVQRLDRPRLDAGEAVQLEGLDQAGDDTLLDHPLGRQQLGEPAERGGLGHVRDLG